MDSSRQALSPLAVSCEHGNEHFSSIKGE